MLAALRLIMLQAIQANISTPTAARVNSGACTPPSPIARPTTTPGKTCIGAQTSADRIYSDKQFEYIETGVKTFPVFGPLQQFARGLLLGVTKSIPSGEILLRDGYKAGQILLR
jgi:hypothetical protein